MPKPDYATAHARELCPYPDWRIPAGSRVCRAVCELERGVTSALCGRTYNVIVLNYAFPLLHDSIFDGRPLCEECEAIAAEIAGIARV